MRVMLPYRVRGPGANACDGDGTVKWTGHNGGYDCSLAGILGCLPRCLVVPWIMDGMTQYLTKINRLDLDMMLSKTMYAGGRRRVYQ